MRENVMGAIKEFFKPEFINRLDEIIFFHPLGKPEISKIVELQLHEVEKRLKEKKISITFTDKLKIFLADKGFDPEFGARPLKRLIQKEILDPLALKIVEGSVAEDSAVTVDALKNTVTIS